MLLYINFMAWGVGATVGSSEECNGSNTPWHQKKHNAVVTKKKANDNMHTIAKNVR